MIGWCASSEDAPLHGWHWLATEFATVFDTGSIIGGRYEVRSVLALGHGTAVYEAVHLPVARLVALKVVDFRTPAHPETRQLFVRNTLQQLALRSPYVVRILDVGIHAHSAFVARELLDGRNLQQQLALQGALPSEDATTFVLHAILGLRAAREAGIPHREVITENLFVAAQCGEMLVKILDLLPRSGPDKPNSAAPYQAPECVVSDSACADDRSMVWNLGAVLYELLTGTRPFSDPRGIARAGAKDEPEPLNQVAAHVPTPLVEVVHGALSRSPRRRPESIEDLAAALIPFAHPGLVVRRPPSTSLIRELAGAPARTDGHRKRR